MPNGLNNCRVCGKETHLKTCSECYIMIHPEECEQITHFMGHQNCDVNNCKDYLSAEIRVEAYLKAMGKL